MVANIFTWWIVVQIVGIIGLPITTFLFRTLPDRGYAFSKSLGILLISYGAWILAMLGLAPFGVPLLVFVAFLVGIIGVVLIMYGGLRTPGTTPITYIKNHWPGIVAYEVVFLLSLIALAWLRAHNPDPWGTERPMDYGFFNAIQRSHTFPPHDPWLAGYSINYYYFGYLMHAAVAMVSGLNPSVAFNLSLALVFALTALNISGVVANLIALTPGTKRQAEPNTQHKQTKRPPLHLLTRPLVALLGVVLVLFAANQSGALQVFVGNYKVVALDGEQFMAAVKQSFSDTDTIELPHPLYTGTNDFGTLTTLDRGDRVEDFNWWWPSRSLWDSLPPEPTYSTQQRTRIYNITEFPFFSFWLGDMHPHVMALPYGLLAMALTLATLARPGLPTFATDRRSWAELALTGLILGSLYVINSWDLPTYWLLYAGALFLLAIRQAEHPDAVPWGKLVWQMVLVTLALYILFLPFYLTFHSLVGSADPLTTLPILSKLTTIIAPYKAGKTEWHAYLTIFGLFVLPVLVFVYLNQRQPAGTRPPLIPGLPWLAPVLLVVGVLIKFPLLALAGVALFALDLAMRRADTIAEAFVLLVILLGCCICFGTELIFIRDVFSNRMNTIFKFYYQVWLLWGTITAYIAWWVLARKDRLVLATETALQDERQHDNDATVHDDPSAASPSTSSGDETTKSAGDSPLKEEYATLPPTEQAKENKLLLVVRGVFTVIFVALLAGSLVYPGINVRNMLRNDTVEGLVGKTPRERTPAGEESLAWLRDNAQSGSVILEMVGPGGGSYNPQGYAGVSASTGIPTVLGWIGHENQWRGGHKAAKDEIGPRQRDVDMMYSTLDIGQLRPLLEKYGITYIYVGMLEREAYAPESLAKFAQVGEPVFQQGEVTIYRVRQ